MRFVYKTSEISTMLHERLKTISMLLIKTQIKPNEIAHFAIAAPCLDREPGNLDIQKQHGASRA
jgi:hypothetical protein